MAVYKLKNLMKSEFPFYFSQKAFVSTIKFFRYFENMKTVEKKLTEYAAGREEIAAAYLFGSEAAGNVHPGSDVDVAFLFQRDKIPSTDELLQIQDELTSLFEKETDVVVLNDASPIIRMQVLRKGKKVYERNRRAVNTFFVRTLNEYDDLKRVRSVIEEKITRGRIYG